MAFIQYPIVLHMKKCMLGGFINHSKNPNCERIKSVAEGTMFTWSLKTLSNILPGEELTLKYTMYDPS